MAKAPSKRTVGLHYDKNFLKTDDFLLKSSAGSSAMSATVPGWMHLFLFNHWSWTALDMDGTCRSGHWGTQRNGEMGLFLNGAQRRMDNIEWLTWVVSHQGVSHLARTFIIKRKGGEDSKLGTCFATEGCYHQTNTVVNYSSKLNHANRAGLCHCACFWIGLCHCACFADKLLVC